MEMFPLGPQWRFMAEVSGATDGQGKYPSFYNQGEGVSSFALLLDVLPSSSYWHLTLFRGFLSPVSPPPHIPRWSCEGSVW